MPRRTFVEVEQAVAAAPSTAGAGLSAGPAPATSVPAASPGGVSAPALDAAGLTSPASVASTASSWVRAEGAAGRHACDHCAATLPTRRALGDHRATVHPFARTAPCYSPPPELACIEPHAGRWTA